MRIAFIGQFDKLHDEEGKAKSFEKLGHAVFRFSEIAFRSETVSDVFDCKPDMLIYAKLKIDFKLKKEIIEGCKKRGIKTVCWVPDLYWGLGREYRIFADVVFKSDFVCTPDGGNNNRWIDAGVNHHTIRQGIYDDDCFVGKKDGKLPEIVFVGCVNGEWPYRGSLIRFLTKTYGKRFHWYGVHDSDEVRNSELNTLYNSAKIVIGDSLYSPYYWSNRIYETIGRGGFIIHPMKIPPDKIASERMVCLTAVWFRV
jgi:hypothetical protein